VKRAHTWGAHKKEGHAQQRRRAQLREARMGKGGAHGGHAWQ
jgi:hypothetical protein